jgi:hypothetical protein
VCKQWFCRELSAISSNQGSAINNSRLANNYIDNWASGNGVGAAKTSCINVNGGTGNTTSGNVLTAAVNGVGFLAYLASGLGDYHLATGSPAIGGGTAGCTGGSTTSPCVPTLDFDGNSQTNPPSIGAYALSTGSGAAGFQLNPSALGFGAQLINTISQILSSTVTNAGSANLTFSSIANPSDPQFFFSGSGTCSISAPVLPGNSCTIAVRFNPNSTGSKSASVTISDNAAGSPHSLALTGVGTTVVTPLPPTGLVAIPQ